MRVLIGNKYWFPKGGTETYIFELIEELESRGDTVIPFSMRHPENRNNPYEEYFVDEVDYHRREGLFRNFTKARRILYSTQARTRLEALVERERPDLAHVHNLYHQISPSILPVLRSHRIPVVMTLHDLKLVCPNYKMRTNGKICERCLSGNFLHAIAQRCVQGSLVKSALCASESFLHRATRVYQDNVDLFIVPSEFFRKKLIEGGLAPDKLVCVPSFTHVERYVPDYGRSDYCVYVGRLSDEKGLPSLVEAMRGLDRGRLVIVGDGPVRSDLERAVARDDLKNVEIVGLKSGEELHSLIRSAAFSIIPSEWYENCPRAGIESFACATPVLAANIGGLPEMVDDGETGLLFEPFSVEDLRAKIAYLFDHEDLVARMGSQARRCAEEKYSAAAHLAKLLPVYASARAGRGAAPSPA